jgi:hypothetical protein
MVGRQILTTAFRIAEVSSLYIEFIAWKHKACLVLVERDHWP